MFVFTFSLDVPLISSCIWSIKIHTYIHTYIHSMLNHDQLFKVEATLDKAPTNLKSLIIYSHDSNEMRTVDSLQYLETAGTRRGVLWFRPPDHRGFPLATNVILHCCNHLEIKGALEKKIICILSIQFQFLFAV